MTSHVLAVAPVSDLDAACTFYQQLFGRGPDNRPMDTLAERRATESGWLQVFADPDRAGSTFVNFAVDDLVEWLSGMRSRGLEPGVVQEVNKGVQLSAICDPDGNTITFIGDFRVEYRAGLIVRFGSTFRLSSSSTIDPLTKDVGVARVTRSLLKEMHQDPAKIDRLRGVGPTAQFAER